MLKKTPVINKNTFSMDLSQSAKGGKSQMQTVNAMGTIFSWERINTKSVHE